MNLPPCSRRQWLLTTGVALSAPLWASDFWARAREPRTVVLVRHAQTEPGVGDPPDFRLGACHTQRNLSADGRQQAQRIGQAFVGAGLRPAEVRSSAWCRCIDTAMLAFGEHRVWAPLNSFFGGRQAEQAQTRTVLATAETWLNPRPLVLVTHQVNITALTGEFPAMGELFACQAEGERLRVVARLVV